MGILQLDGGLGFSPCSFQEPFSRRGRVDALRQGCVVYDGMIG